MADLARTGDLDVKIVGTDGVTPVDVVVDTDTENALKIKGNVNIEGSSGSQATLSTSNRIETNLVSPSVSGNNLVLDLTVPAGKTWYLKGLMIGTTRTATFSLAINSVTKIQGNLDASDSFDIPLYGYETVAGITVQVYINTSANQDLSGNLIIYEE